MNKHMILYRGSLKSCNYRCSYCPFSKHSMPERALEKDRIQWFSFVESVQKKAKTLHIGALMVVPYGEAMIHSWYWEGLAYLSAQAELEAVGIQTNLSFSISDFLDCFESLGGVLEKLRLWATFHPEMTSVSEFSAKCKYLAEQGIQICAGSVGVPENLNLLRALKQELQSSDENGQGIYLWVNKMDGLGRSYTQKERTAFVEIDPYFERELVSVSANAALCQGRLFVEANGKMRTCNISATLNTGKCLEALEAFPNPECSRKQCSCYLAYGGREDFMKQKNPQRCTVYQFDNHSHSKRHSNAFVFSCATVLCHHTGHGMTNVLFWNICVIINSINCSKRCCCGHSHCIDNALYAKFSKLNCGLLQCADKTILNDFL